MTKKAGQQTDINGEVIPTPEVKVSLRDVSYVEVVAKTEKFTLKTRNTAIQDVDIAARPNFVAKRLRPEKDAEIERGDFDHAVQVVTAALVQYYP